MHKSRFAEVRFFFIFRNMGDLAVNALTLAFPVQMLRIADRRALCGVAYNKPKRQTAAELNQEGIF